MKPSYIIIGLVGAVALAFFAINTGISIFGRFAEPEETFIQFAFGEQGYASFILSAATLLGGAITVALLLQRARVDDEQTELARQAAAHGRMAEVATRFQKGIELLAAPDPTVHLGAIYILRDVANDSPDLYRQTVVQTLVGYARNRSKERAKLIPIAKDQYDVDDEADPIWAEAFKPTEPEVIEAFTIAGQQRALLDARGRKATEVDMTGLVLIGRQIEGAHFGGCDFGGVHISDMHFLACTLDHAVFKFSSRESVEFMGCSLHSAHFERIGAPGGGRSYMSATYCRLDRSTIKAVSLTVVLTKCGFDRASLHSRSLTCGDCWFETVPPDVFVDAKMGVTYCSSEGHGTFNELYGIEIFQPRADATLYRVLPDRQVEMMSGIR